MIRTLRLATACLLLSGCGETAYKMGGGGAEFHQDQKICASSDEDTYKACMKQKGWTIMGLGSLRVASVEQDLKPAEPAAAPAPATPASTSPAPKIKGDSSATPPKTISTAASAPSPAAPAKTRDPNERVIVNSWWKYGVTDFKGDTRACTAKLGDAHTYDESKHVTTRAFAACMREKGWYAY